MNDQASNNPQSVLSQAVEREVRFVIGDLHMQNIVLRQMLEMAQHGQQPQMPIPQQAPAPHPEVKPNGSRPTAVS